MAVGRAVPADEVRVSIVKDPALVRTVRLVAAAVARSTRVDDVFVEEVRLAVGEACALLVGEVTDGPPDFSDPVTVVIALGDNFQVDVVGNAPVAVAERPLGDVEGLEPWVLIRALVDDFAIVQDGPTTRVSMSWPVPSSQTPRQHSALT